MCVCVCVCVCVQGGGVCVAYCSAFSGIIINIIIIITRKRHCQHSLHFRCCCFCYQLRVIYDCYPALLVRCFTSTRTIRTVETGGRPPRISHGSWALKSQREGLEAKEARGDPIVSRLLRTRSLNARVGLYIINDFNGTGPYGFTSRAL